MNRTIVCTLAGLLMVLVMFDSAVAQKAKPKSKTTTPPPAPGFAGKLEGHEGPVYAVAFTGDGKQILSGGFDHTLYIWDVSKSKLLSKTSITTGRIWGIVNWQVGKGRATTQFAAITTTHGGDQFCIMNLTTPGPTMKLDGYGHGVDRVQLIMPPRSTGFLFGNAGDGRLHTWDVASGKHLQYIDVIEPGRAWVASEDAKWVACQSQGVFVRWYDLATKKALLKSAEHPAHILALHNPKASRQVYSICADKKLRTLNATTGAIVEEVELPCSGITSSAMSVDGSTILIGDETGAVFVISTDTGKAKAQFTKHQDAVHCVAFSPDHKQAASGAKGGDICIWNLPE